MGEALDRLKQAVLALDGPAWVHGTAPRELGIAVDGEPAPMGGGLAAWLTKRSEPAPFGHQQQTRIDDKVRSTLRLKARGRTKITGLDLTPIVATIESALAAHSHLNAELLDVLVYPPGGRFLRHKDTPRTAAQLGTLIIEVPCAHTGGVMTLDDHDERLRLDWSTPGPGVRWVALFGDVDHDIADVKTGHRITLVYTLALSGAPRVDPQQDAHKMTLQDAIIALQSATEQLPAELYIACSRMANAPATGLITLDGLRSVDRLIADAFIGCGYQVAVHEVLIGAGDDTRKFPSDFWAAYAIRKPIPAELLDGEALSFTDHPEDDEGGGDYITSIEPYLAELAESGVANWIVRAKAGATVVFDGLYAENGYFGNEASYGQIYKVAALQVTL